MNRARGILFASLAGLWAMQAAAQTADLLISKSGAESAAAGETIVYSIYVFNGGPSDALNVTMMDTLPSGTTFVSLSASTALFSCTAPAAGTTGTVQCTASTLINQANTTFTLSVRTSTGAPSGSITNTATVTSSTPDANMSDNSSTVTTGIAAGTTTSADLSIESMRGSSSVSSGATLSFQVVIANKGPSTAHHVQFADTPPANTTFLSATVADPLEAFACATPAAGTSGNITCSAASFDAQPSDQPPVFLFTFRVNNGVSPGTPLTNTATLSSDDADPIASNNTASSTTTTTAATPSADLSVVTTGGGANFTVRLSNSGPNDATGVTLTETIPSGSTFQAWTQTRGPLLTCNTPPPGGSGTITCTTAVFPGIDGTTISSDFELTVDASGQVVNNVSVSSTTSDPRLDNNTASYPVPARLTIDDISVFEGDTGSTAALFPVHLQPANATLTATVHYHVRGITATDGSDFIGSDGTLTFLAGQTLKTISIPVLGDTIAEGNETFAVELSNAVNAIIAGATAICTIVDDDLGLPSVPGARIDSASVVEGNSGTTNATFTARLLFASANVSRIRWKTQDGSAKAGSDYIASSGEVVFQPGEIARTFVVPIIGDTDFEPDESFDIVVTGADNATIFLGVDASCVILNDDAAPPPKRRAVRR